MANEILTTHIPYSSRSDQFTLHVVGDLHIGNRAVIEPKIKQLVTSIAEDPQALVVLMGDLVDCISILDRKRFDAHDLADWITVKDLDNLAVVEAEHLITMLEPIKPQIICYLGGNHEESLSKNDNHSIPNYIAVRLNIPYLGDAGAAIRLSFNRSGHSTSYNGYLLHGWGGGRSEATKQSKLNQLLKDQPDADFVCLAHDHSRLMSETYQAYYGRTKLEWRHRIGVMCGAFISNPRYARRHGYPPSFPGHAKLIFTPDKRSIGVRFDED